MSAASRALSIGVVALPPAIAAGWLVFRGESAAVDPATGISSVLVSVALAAFLAWWVEGRLQRRLRTVSSVLAAFREGDFSVRARNDAGDTPLAEVVTELNQLGDVLRAHRLGEMEAWALLRKVMAEVDVVVIAIDEDGLVRLANDAASRLLGRTSKDVVGARASELGLGDLLEGAVPRIIAANDFGRGTAKDRAEGDVRRGAEGLFDPSAGRWELRRGSFRLSGEPQTLLVLADVSRALRDNEREAWKRLVRVIGHEINNSLSPIKSISESLLRLVDPNRIRDAEWEQDIRDGLGVVGRRAEALGRFMTSYATLARLPPPVCGPVDVAVLMQKIVRLEKRLPVELVGGPDVTVHGDADQLEQALINLVKNAAEASLETAASGKSTKPAGVSVRWTREEDSVAVAIEDDGPGVGETANLFVPFFTTKPNGSGIGLALSRQIVEAHDGQLSLSSRPGGGAVARIRLPLLALQP